MAYHFEHWHALVPAALVACLGLWWRDSRRSTEKQSDAELMAAYRASKKEDGELEEIPPISENKKALPAPSTGWGKDFKMGKEQSDDRVDDFLSGFRRSKRAFYEGRHELCTQIRL